jgi:hypothetical protein
LNDKLGIYYLLAFLSFFFHYSSFPMFFFPMFIKIFNTRRRCLVLVIIGFLIASINSTDIGNQIRGIIYRLESFTGISKSSGMFNIVSIYNLKYLSLLVVFFGLCYLIDPCNKRDMLLLQSFALGLCFYYYFIPTRLDIISIRFSEFYISILIILIPNVFLNRLGQNKLVLALITVYMCFYSYAVLKTTGRILLG